MFFLAKAVQSAASRISDHVKKIGCGAVDLQGVALGVAFGSQATTGDVTA